MLNVLGKGQKRIEWNVKWLSKKLNGKLKALKGWIKLLNGKLKTLNNWMKSLNGKV